MEVLVPDSWVVTRQKRVESETLGGTTASKRDCHSEAHSSDNPQYCAPCMGHGCNGS